MRFSLLLSVLAAFQVYTHIVVRYGGDDSTPSSLGSRGGHLSLNPRISGLSHYEKRATRSKCSAQFTLWRRTMVFPDGDDMMSFMRNELDDPSRRPVIWEKHIMGQPQDMATADFASFKEENKAFGFGTGGLLPNDSDQGFDRGGRGRWDEIKSTVGGLIPELKEEDRWDEIK
ncbi:uncharacterized protein BP5553_10404 [Venustampulla echinocandica]|uniref:Uncharacterized protein n=1 Tax=Venustampulla echinocandica TaxID=2656787 RepID=A0A370T972_9HELO|nr:uncharacterized protein BP5553_10404 [Venustampulla echinocandica]RDL30126.1 hypothetical protein BP5553_10404 [Venustampulla echinocandica]